jgi:hypothetical protein
VRSVFPVGWAEVTPAVEVRFPHVNTAAVAVSKRGQCDSEASTFRIHLDTLICDGSLSHNAPPQ